MGGVKIVRKTILRGWDGRLAVYNAWGAAAKISKDSDNTLTVMEVFNEMNKCQELRDKKGFYLKFETSKDLIWFLLRWS